MPETLNPAAALLQETLAAHRFSHSTEGDGWSERLMESFDCSCGHSHYALWVQEDPQLSGRREFQSDTGLFLEAHSKHLAGVLGPVLAAAWDDGHAAGSEPAGGINPHRGTRDDPAPSVALRYPSGS